MSAPTTPRHRVDALENGHARPRTVDDPTDADIAPWETMTEAELLIQVGHPELAEVWSTMTPAEQNAALETMWQQARQARRP